MSTQARGRVIVQGTATGIAGLVVTLTDVSMLWTNELGRSPGPKPAPNLTQADGSFAIGPYADSTSFDFGGSVTSARKVRLDILTSVSRLLASKELDDPTTNPLDFGDISLAAGESDGFPITLGGSSLVAPVRDGNGVRMLIDDAVAWKHIATSLDNATTSISMMQLELDVPQTYNADATQEHPEIVLAFATPIDPKNPPKTNQPADFRPERILLKRAAAGVKTRILISGIANFDPGAINAPSFVLLMLLVLIVFVLPVTSPFAIYFLIKYLNFLSKQKSVAQYFSQAASTVDTQLFTTRLFNVVHAKLALIDESEAIVIGSPFVQGYYDTPAHPIDQPMRGTGVDVPIHDVSIAVRGPAVADMHAAFALHWNHVKPADIADTIPPPAPLATGADADEHIATLQLMRTINESVFPAPLDKGENGILEGYLRAIGSAKKYIYLENQYFTNDTIAKALIAALNTQSQLEIIMVINLKPDVPFYPGWQNGLIKQIRLEGDATRIGFFCTWSHEAADADHPKPRIIPNYVHTKVAFVDDVWGTAGSANLDGASLDYFQVLHALQSGNIRNHELNYAIFNDAAHPKTDLIDTMRRNLWGEHLGIPPGDPQLQLGGANDGKWLAFWRAAAERKRNALVGNPGTPDVARVLEYKNPDSKAKNFLKNLSIGLDGLELVDKVRPFSFFKGDWV